MKFTLNLSCIRFLGILLPLLSQITRTANGQDYLFENKNYQEMVQTVLLYPVDEPLAEPVMQHGGEEQLQLSFDLLENDAEILNYTLQHCSWDWQASDLQKIEYIEGYEEDQIETYRYSINTYTPYVHYDLRLPSAEMRLKRSGNYLLIVYRDHPDKENILFTRRLMVVEPLVSIAARIPQYPKNPDYVGRKHQIDVTVAAENAFTVSPQQSLKLVIRQNGRWDNAVNGLAPNYVYPDKISWEYDEATVFDGGNQFRNFDMKSYKYQSEYIKQMGISNNIIQVELWPSKKRSMTNYHYEKDIFGGKYIRARDDQETDVEGDYALVYFFLEYPVPFTHEDMHILGALTDWNLDANSKMTYNFQRKGYEAKLFLKQGYYNYQFTLLERGKKKADVTAIEGDYWDTQSQYLILLYYRKPGTVYDQLVSTALITSHPNP